MTHSHNTNEDVTQNMQYSHLTKSHFLALFSFFFLKLTPTVNWPKNHLNLSFTSHNDVESAGQSQTVSLAVVLIRLLKNPHTLLSLEPHASARKQCNPPGLLTGLWKKKLQLNSYFHKGICRRVALAAHLPLKSVSCGAGPRLCSPWLGRQQGQSWGSHIRGNNHPERVKRETDLPRARKKYWAHFEAINWTARQTALLSTKNETAPFQRPLLSLPVQLQDIPQPVCSVLVLERSHPAP